MDNVKVNSWLQTAANIGIVLGLVLVGLQIKQNSELTKIQLLYEESRRIVELETQVVGENAAEVWAKSIEAPESLTLAEVRIMEALLWSFVEQLRGTYNLAQLGLIEEQDWRKRVESEVDFYLSDPYSRAWWRNYADPEDDNVPAELYTAIQAVVEADDDQSADYILAPQRSLQNNSEQQ